MGQGKWCSGTFNLQPSSGIFEEHSPLRDCLVSFCIHSNFASGPGEAHLWGALDESCSSMCHCAAWGKLAQKCLKALGLSFP